MVLFWTFNNTFVTFAPNTLFGQLWVISSNNLFLKAFSLEISYIEVYFTDQNSKTMEREDEINITLVINWCVTKKDTLFNWP